MSYSSDSPAVLHFYVPVFGKVVVLPVRLTPRLRFYFYLFVVVSVSILDVPLPSSAQSGGPADLPEVAERAKVDQQLADLNAKSDALTEEMNKLTNPQPATLDIVDSQRKELIASIASLTEMRNTLQGVIEISRLMPKLSGNTATTARNKLADLRFQLAKMRVGGISTKVVTANSSSLGSTAGIPVVSAASPAAPQDASAATGPTPNTGAKEQVSLAVKDGSLTGRILADLTGEPIAQAVVIARCGSNGEAEYTTRTDENGIYQFTAITATPCLVEAAKYLSSPDTRLEEFDRVQATKSARSARASGQPKDAATAYAEQREAERTRSPEAQLQERQAKYSAVNKANPDLQSFAARTLKNLTPSQGGSTELVQDIRLAPAKTSIGEFARAIVGLEQSGASSAQSTQNYFADLWISLPMPFFTSKSKLSPSPNDFNFGPRNRIWGDFRITSAPQQISASVGDFAIGFADQIANVQVNKVAQATEFMIGEENRLSGWGLTEQRFLSFDHSTRQRFALYFTAGFGRVTPLNPKDNVQLFNNPTLGTEPAFDQQIANLGLTSQLAGKRFVAFASRDRFKFYKEYYAGLRMKTFYYDKDTDEPLGRFPASLEAVIGQNETVTGGRLHRPVVRLEGFFPLPYDSVKYLYLFGTADLIVGGQKGGDAIILQSADNPPPVPDPSILLIQTPQLDRDHYRIGVGIDFMQLVKAIQDRNKNKPDVK